MAKGDKNPVVMTGDIDSTVAKKLHAPQHAAGGSDPITPQMIGAAVNDNLLDNGYFLNLVNQRGQTEYRGAVQGVDRWFGLGAYSVAQVTEFGLRVYTTADASAFCRQRLEFPAQYLGRKVTLSVLAARTDTMQFTLSKKTVQLPDVFPDETTELGRASIAILNISSTNIWVDFVTKVDYTIAAVKLELGDTQTLAHQDESGNWVLNEIPDYGEELAKCQRYQCKLEKGGYFRSEHTTTNSLVFSVPVPVTLRATPTIIGAMRVYSGASQSGFTFSVAYSTGTGYAQISALKDGHGLSEAVLCLDETIILDANV